MYAGRFLVRRFSNAGERNPGDAISWDTHRWVRFRSLMPLLEELNAGLLAGYRCPSSVGVREYGELIRSKQAEYEWTGRQGLRAFEVTDLAMRLAGEWTRAGAPPSEPVDPAKLPSPDLSLLPPRAEVEYDDGRPFALGLPRPRPAIRIVREF
jgi:hypothetical protein